MLLCLSMVFGVLSGLDAGVLGAALVVVLVALVLGRKVSMGIGELHATVGEVGATVDDVNRAVNHVDVGQPTLVEMVRQQGAIQHAQGVLLAEVSIGQQQIRQDVSTLTDRVSVAEKAIAKED